MQTFTSLASLRTFEAVARLRSMTRAAEELGVTQGAVSRAIQALEGDLGSSLFRRSRPHLHLTEAGELLFADVKPSFNQLGMAVMRVRNLRQTGRLAIDALPTFAIRFLIRRLPNLQKLYPEISVDLTVSERLIDFETEPIDIAIRYGSDGQWPQTGYRRMMEEELVLVCAPEIRARYGEYLAPSALKPEHLLRHTTRTEAWSEWFDLVDVEPVEPRGLGLEHFIMVIEAAVGAMGFALLPRFMIQAELSSGALVIASSRTLHRQQGYYMLFSPERQRDTRIVLFERWLRAEIHRDALASLANLTRNG